MARRGSRARTHAWLARDLAGRAGDGVNPMADDPDEPFLPEVGDIYLVVTRIYALGFDPAARRPAVVVTVPPVTVTHTPIQIVTRTSDTSAPGIAHPKDTRLNLDKKGVFSEFGSVEPTLWTPRNVLRLGTLGEPYIGKILERFA
jgi:hypothetical protein